MDDQAVFRVDLGNVLQVKREVVDWATHWRPDSVAVSATQRAPLEVLRVVLSWPSGWGEVASVSRALSTSLKRATKVYNG
eukprot:233186-Alexandrium_andersonii.AAC.1